jgi:hypothetical protein
VSPSRIRPGDSTSQPVRAPDVLTEEYLGPAVNIALVLRPHHGASVCGRAGTLDYCFEFSLLADHELAQLACFGLPADEVARSSGRGPWMGYTHHGQRLPRAPGFRSNSSALTHTVVELSCTLTF